MPMRVSVEARAASPKVGVGDVEISLVLRIRSMTPRLASDAMKAGAYS